MRETLTLHTDELPRGVKAAIAVAALGYFVDIYDLVLFNIVRIPSLKSLGLVGDQLTSTGLMLLNYQMTGMLIGGLLWGILGDKRGRLSVLFGSICREYCKWIRHDRSDVHCAAIHRGHRTRW